MKKLLQKMYHLVMLFCKLNITKTLYFNFKVLPFRRAIKLPFFLYGKIHLCQINGIMELPENISTGMIKIGYKWIDLWPLSFLPTQIQNCGRLIFKGKCIISGGVNLNVQSADGTLTLGDCSFIGGGSVVKCLDKVCIGNSTRITGNCVVMDCNMHFVKKIDDGTIANYKAPITIGDNCWINYGTVISKGAVIPNYCITSRNSLVSKNFSELGDNLFLIGSPAKPASYRVQRIFSIEKQREYADYFKNNHVNELQLKPGLETETGTREGF